MAVVEHGERPPRRAAVLAPGEQAGAALFAEHPVEPLGGGIAIGLALHRDRGLRKQRAGEERRAHCLLAVAAMAEADVDRLALRLEPHRAAQAAAFPGHDLCSFLNARIMPHLKMA